ncbi:GntR family transcriptional regulator [Afipia carboxidovorans]|uniref:GntR family transcriptional regulator n=1 Tax=Afipia carboxidovorans TaxID=40137 RepID=UPI00308ADF3B|nr:GntR family transcriptional regulator [Afipia carboxidovorans]
MAKAIGTRPLYSQIREQFLHHLEDRTWAPGMLIPSEIELARKFGVSQGTVRKALNEMTAERLLTRQQGRGTFVTEPEDSRILFKFFHLTPDKADPTFPVSRFLSRTKGAATAEEAAALAIHPGDAVWRIRRNRSFGQMLILTEVVVLAVARFPDLPEATVLPNNLYQLFSTRWRITIAQADEQLRAVSATKAIAQTLGCEPGTALLQIRRIARDLGERPVELRTSHCLTDHIHYTSNLR